MLGLDFPRGCRVTVTDLYTRFYVKLFRSHRSSLVEMSENNCRIFSDVEEKLVFLHDKIKGHVCFIDRRSDGLKKKKKTKNSEDCGFFHFFCMKLLQN